MKKQLIVTLVRTWVIELCLWAPRTRRKNSHRMQKPFIEMPGRQNQKITTKLKKKTQKNCFLVVKNPLLRCPAGPPESQKNNNKFVKNFEKSGFFLQKTLYWGSPKNPLLRFWIFFRRRGDVAQTEESIAHALTFFLSIPNFKYWTPARDIIFIFTCIIIIIDNS